MSGHTPGPWKAVPWHIEEGPPAVRCAEGWIVASTSNDENARFIAAAPDMLEALQALVSRIEYYSSLRSDERPNIEDWEYTEGSGDMAKARAAIKKATT